MAVETGHTTNRNYPYPIRGFVDEGPANIQAAAEGPDKENRGEIDYLQAGVVTDTDWSFVASMENSATCALASLGATGGTAWLPSTAVGLLRSVTSAATLKALTPPSRPGSGKYLTVGFELTPTTSGKAATVSVVSGLEKASQAEAEAAPPATTAGKIKIRNVVIKNTAGVYSIVAQFDKRQWATGGGAPETVAEGELGDEVVTSEKVKAGTLKGDRIANATITGDKLNIAGILEPMAGRIGAGSEYEPHATRPTFVVIYCMGTENKVEIEGKIVDEAKTKESKMICLCQPKQKYKLSGIGGGEIFHTTYYVL